jgi:hypothetical protein
MSGGGGERFNIIALAGAVIAAIGLIFVVAADRMQDEAMDDYIQGLPYIQYLNRIDSSNSVWTIGVVFIAIAVILVAFAVRVNDADALDRTKRRLELELSSAPPSSEQRHGKKMKPEEADESGERDLGGAAKRI